MAERIQFTRNYTDLSTNQGFQFEFHCDRCGSGYRTKFQSNALGMATSAMDAANSLLGGVFGRAADLAERARSAAWEKAHDAAFEQSMNELKPEFVQCQHCMSWVCRKSCWNNERGMCKNCAPDIHLEMAAAQVSKTREKIWETAQSSDEETRTVTNQTTWKSGVKAACPSCGANLQGSTKFCPECGMKLNTKSFCTDCGAEMIPGAKFCSECGKKM